MTATSQSAEFWDDVPVLSRFRDLTDQSVYVPLPQDWTLGLADVVASTRAIEAGRYKSVNMAGAAVISAVSNATDRRPFPFVFGGDGASFAIGPGREEASRCALADTAALVRDEFGLELRVAQIPVAVVRDAGHDVRVARFAASPDVSYAMFSGGGLAWAETALKRGHSAIEPGPKGARPDLTGLSCRFEATPNRRGVILSIIAKPVLAADDPRYRAAIENILTLVEDAPERARPVPDTGAKLSWPPLGLDQEARTRKQPGASLTLERIRLFMRTGFSHLIFRTGMKVGGFDPKLYLREMAANSDYRKYDDGLRLTIDCSVALADEIERQLVEAERAGVLVHGSQRQDEALITCLTPAIDRHDHIHFVDGAAGGYAAAAAKLKLPA